MPSIVQCLARKDGTDDFYQLKVSKVQGLQLFSDSCSHDSAWCNVVQAEQRELAAETLSRAALQASLWAQI